jgi:hypothetical protein
MDIETDSGLESSKELALVWIAMGASKRDILEKWK